MQQSGSKQKRVRRVLLMTGAAAAAAVLYALLAAKGLAIPCPLFKLTGLMCPGCGNTRAALALLGLDIAASLRFNLMFIPEIIYIGFVYAVSCINYVKTGYFRYTAKHIRLDISVLVMLVLWGILRNVIHF